MDNSPRLVEPNTSVIDDSSYTFILHDKSVCQMEPEVAAGGNVGATTPFFVGDDDAPNSKTLVAKSVRISVVPVQSAAVTQLTVVGNDTGATTSLTINNPVTLAYLAGAE